MNCPNCDKKPTGIFYIFRSRDFDFKTRMEGYFKCRHCGATLKQKKTSIGFPSFDALYYVYNILLVGILAVSTYYIFQTFESLNISTGLEIGTFGVLMVLALTGINLLASRYRNIEEVDLNEEKPEPRKLTKSGLVVFFIYMVVTIGLFLGVYKYVDLRELGFVLYLVVQTVYLVAVMVGAFFLFKYYSTQEAEATE